MTIIKNIRRELVTETRVNISLLLIYIYSNIGETCGLKVIDTKSVIHLNHKEIPICKLNKIKKVLVPTVHVSTCIVKQR